MITLVAGDAAPSGAFRAVNEVLKERNVASSLIVGDGKVAAGTEREVESAVTNSKVVCLGMSSTLLEEECSAAELARSHGVTYGFYGDVPGCWKRPQFREYAEHASFYLGVSQYDANEARGLFLRAQLVGTGNPLREAAAFPTRTTEEVRAMLELGLNDVLVVAPGGKFADANTDSWFALTAALRAVQDATGLRFFVAFSKHPADPTDYSDLIAGSPVRARMVEKGFIPTTDLVPAAALAVGCWMPSTEAQAPMFGVPVITVEHETMRKHREGMNQALEGVDNGVAILVPCSDGAFLARAIMGVLDPAATKDMRRRMTERYPLPTERGAAARNIADVLIDFAK